MTGNTIALVRLGKCSEMILQWLGPWRGTPLNDCGKGKCSEMVLHATQGVYYLKVQFICTRSQSYVDTKTSLRLQIIVFKAPLPGLLENHQYYKCFILKTIITIRVSLLWPGSHTAVISIIKAFAIAVISPTPDEACNWTGWIAYKNGTHQDAFKHQPQVSAAVRVLVTVPFS